MSDLEILKKLLGNLSPEERAELLGVAVEEKKEESSTGASRAERKGVAVNDDFTVHRDNESSYRKPVRARENSWVDTGEERQEDKIVKTATVTKRPKAVPVDVVCSTCHRTVKVPPSLPRTEYYRCERCIG